MSRAEQLERLGVREVEVSIVLTLPVTAPQEVEDRLIGALSTYAADLMWVREAGIRKAARPYDDLLFLWNEVALAAPIVHGMAPADDVWGGMTCTEAEAVAGIFAAAGHPEVHDFIIAEHAVGDDDCEDMHHDKDVCPSCHKEETNE
jgi:hypothetical protein